MGTSLRRVSVVLAAVMAWTGDFHDAWAQSFTVTDLGTLGGAESYARDVNTAHSVVGGADNGSVTLPFIWLPAAAHGYSAGMNALPLPFGDSSGYALGVQESDGAVGYTIGANGTRAVLWGNPPIDLGTLPGQYSPIAFELNEQFEVVGSSLYDLGGLVREQGFLWLPAPMYQLPAGMHAINLLAGHESCAAQDINDSEFIAGTCTHVPINELEPITERGFIYDVENGQLTALSRLTTAAHRSSAQAINDANEIVGDSQIDSNPNGVYHAVKWDANGQISDMGTTGGFSLATDINQFGDIVGWMQSTGSFRAFWSENGVLRDLNTLIDPGSGWTLNEAEGVSDSKAITGQGTINGQLHAFLAAPNPPMQPAVPAPPHDRKKNRYISFTPNNGTKAVAFNVTKANPPDGSCWVQAPVPAGPVDEYTAQCDSTPVYRVWNEPVVHVGDCEIIPVASYWVWATDGIFQGTPRLFSTILLPGGGKWWGDSVGSNNGSEWTAPNGITNVNDVTALLAFISGAAIKPHFTAANLQAIGADDSCLNAAVNASDVLIAVQAVAGATYGPPSTAKIVDPTLCQPCSAMMEGFAGGGGGGSFGPAGFGPGGQGPDGFTSTPTFGLTSVPYQINAGATATVDVYLDAALMISAYEVSLDVEGGTGGTLTREAIAINTGQSDFIFAGHNVFQATNAETNVAGAVEGAGVGVLATEDEYLATYTFRASADAYGVFEVRVSDTRSFLLNDVGNQTAHDASAVAYVRVGVECTAAIHCDDGNQCTSDVCTNGECVNTNSPSGTACNDGLFCTLTDTCNGSGVCVGSAATPCVRPNPVCCENYDSCHPAGYSCELE